MSPTSVLLRDELRRLRIELRILNDVVAAKASLNPRDLDILDVIDREGPCTPSALAERTGYRRATLTSVINRLHRDGWIIRATDPGDRRSSTLASTDRFDELRALYAAADDIDTVLFQKYTEQQRATFVQMLSLVTTHLRELNGGNRRNDLANIPRRAHHECDCPDEGCDYSAPEGDGSWSENVREGSEDVVRDEDGGGVIA
jgi:DNA-binding MarR family transcriptional regulator